MLGKGREMAQPIDENVLFAAQRAIARARGQEVFIAPVADGADPSASAKLYKITTASAEGESTREAQRTAPQEPVKTSNKQHRGWFFKKGEEDAAGVVIHCDPASGHESAPEAGITAISEQVAEHTPAPAPVPRTPLKHEAEESEVPHFKLACSRSAYGSKAELRSSAEACDLFLNHFFAQLVRCGVKNAVVSPGVQSTALALKAREHFEEVYVDSDERSAAFFALGVAKATGNAVILIGSGATAAANWMPAVLEAEMARVPLMLLTADKPAYLQSHGYAGASGQLQFFGGHVKRFFQMPIPSKKPEDLSFACQIALDACIACHGNLPNVSCADAGPVHINFPFANPIKPISYGGKVLTKELPAAVFAGQGLMPKDARGLFDLIRGKRVVAVCGEGTCGSTADARQLLNFAHTRNVPLFADALSGLRSFSDSMIIDHFDPILGGEAVPHIEVVIRFGRWPLSDRLTEAIKVMGATQIVVDTRDSRDYTNTTDIFVHCAPTVFCEAMTFFDSSDKASRRACREWQTFNDLMSHKLRAIKLRDGIDDYEGAYMYELLEAAPANSLVWVANGMSMVALDLFYCKGDKRLKVLANRGAFGIDGVLSSAFGAAQKFEQTTVVTGDMAFLHDVNALALQNEFRVRENHGAGKMPSIVVVLLNNCGAGAFEMLPEKPEDDSFERLFVNPQSIDFKRLADGFGVTCRTVTTVNTFRRTYAALLGEPGINILEVLLPIAGMRDRFAEYRQI